MKKDALELAFVVFDIVVTLIAIVGAIWFFFVK